MLSNKKKLSFATGLDESKLKGTYGSIETTGDAMKLGGMDYLLKPQPFHHIENGQLIKPVTAVPKLERPIQRETAPTPPPQPQPKPEEEGGALILE